MPLLNKPKIMRQQTIISGGYTEFKTFSNPVYYNFAVNERSTSKRRAEKRRLDNLSRAKKKVLRLTMANELRVVPIFLTCTYAETMLDREVAVLDTSKFLRKLKKHFPQMGYLYTLERQVERGKQEGNAGTWHSHILLFNVSFIPISMLQELWAHGTFKINKTNDALHCAFYISKYITKDGTDLSGNKRVFSASHNLLKPIMFRRIVHEIFKGKLTSETIRTNVVNNIILTRSYYDKNRRDFFSST